MYNNVGKKIQTLAKILAWVGIIFFVLVGAVTIYGGLNTYNYVMVGQGVLFALICPVLCWLSSLTAFGFGSLIETNEKMKNDIQELRNTIENRNK